MTNDKKCFLFAEKHPESGTGSDPCIVDGWMNFRVAAGWFTFYLEEMADLRAFYDNAAVGNVRVFKDTVVVRVADNTGLLGCTQEDLENWYDVVQQEDSDD